MTFAYFSSEKSRAPAASRAGRHPSVTPRRRRRNETLYQQPLSHGCAVPAPLTQGSLGAGASTPPFGKGGCGVRWQEEGSFVYDPLPKWEPQKPLDLAENHIDFTDAA